MAGWHFRDTRDGNYQRKLVFGETLRKYKNIGYDKFGVVVRATGSQSYHSFLSSELNSSYIHRFCMAEATRLWVIDDNPDIRAAFAYALIKEGYAVTEFENGGDALAQLEASPPALIILDVDMPVLDGWQTLQELRTRGCLQPVLMITGTNDVGSRVRGLELGADDYIGKPCQPTELVARVRALLRRTTPPFQSAIKLLIRGDVKIDLDRKTATKGNERLALTRTDFALLKLLSENKGAPVSRETILRDIWKARAGNSHALDTHLWRLRKKLGDTNDASQWIQNIPGIGFMMNDTP